MSTTSYNISYVNLAILRDMGYYNEAQRLTIIGIFLWKRPLGFTRTYLFFKFFTFRNKALGWLTGRFGGLNLLRFL